ncbi:MAG: DUF2591 domain-containing protein [Colwellia sp.]|nr:DUF2591 domain-containing protein [Colwellia sp.]
MDYSKLSDFEINKLVAEKLGVYHEGWSHLVSDYANEVPVMVDNSVFWADYCNDACSAWPIILDNSICIEKRSDKTEFWRAITWNQISGNEYRPIHQDSDRNPLRAAMVVFLMASENE